jgi:hypothetical protein
MEQTTPGMTWADKFVSATLKAFLIISGLATCLPIVLAYNMGYANEHLFSGLLEYGPSSVPALRHWGIMVFGIGVLMIASAFRPWLRFETMVFSAVEKSFMVYLFLASRGQPWGHAYFGGFVIDLTIVTYSLVYFVSNYGRPRRWTSHDE